MKTSLPFAIGLFLFSIYLLTFSGKFHVMDELAVFSAANNLAQHGRADINQLIWTNHWTPNPPGVWGNDSILYTKKAPGISFITAPLIWLGHAIPGLNAVHVGLLTNSLVTALTASLLFLWLIDLGFSQSVATITTLSYGLCTIAWVYARMFWESSMLALCFLVAVWSVYPIQHQAKIPKSKILWCGLAMAIGLTLRFETAIAILLIELYLFYISVTDCKSVTSTKNLKSTILYIVPIILTIFGLLYFNLTRFGSLSETGYTKEILFQRPWIGCFGLLFSPGRGLFIYAPIMVLLFWGIRPTWQRLPRAYFGLIAMLCLSYWIFYGSWYAWGGTWGWGPRFLLPILPLLMLFVAETLQSKTNQLTSKIGVCFLIILSLIVNFLGITVDFNEHFLRLGSNDNFLFNLGAFPPVAHWQILQEGLVDLSWLRATPNGLTIEWAILTPALLLLLVSSLNLAVVWFTRPDLTGLKNLLGLLLLALTLTLTYQTMRATAEATLKNEPSQADLAILQTLTTSAKNGDALLVTMPPFGDVQEMTTWLMAYLDVNLPTFMWIESPPRAIEPAEREQVWQAVSTAPRVWLFERWLTPNDPLHPTARHFNQTGFALQEQWFTHSGRLSLYAQTLKVSKTFRVYDTVLIPPTALNVPFEGGVTLVDFSLLGQAKPGETLKLRLTWQLAPSPAFTDSLVLFTQLLNEARPPQAIAQLDRLLIDPQNFKKSPLWPGQTMSQGYGLKLPNDLAVGAYPLIIGLYHPASSQRLRRIDGNSDDFLYLTTIKANEN